ncbi:hypothetical protein PICMEDRAFT_15516 [Pichia membranifaciens NRRL Y-2026]|uniref:Uncharacterized protein n=1 Tax=Pichia membranifaciens NRRL Y-2026 TaxID=763406 RepID=A0A1E3NN95_9ASCO|nr:hypothetical protein PICMEDRAFT_15516 [Pichia membranifaciens NRRL Y-2026]ODQ47580.1 hypothetical protein PICMEDRAFT_15516 [Pichia membranifaciens NRRL Y-2026]
MHNPNELLNRFGNKGGNTRSPSPTRKTISSSNQFRNRMRPHAAPFDKSAKTPKLMPLQDSFRSKEMKDVAFEVTVDIDDNAQNLHPLDEPFILRNGKPIYPSDASPTRLNKAARTLSNDIKMEDVISLTKSVWNLAHSLLLAFWNIDLYFNVTISENSTMKVHIPTLVFSLVVLRLFFSISTSGPHETYSAPVKHSSSSSSSFVISTLVLLSAAAYWYNYCHRSSDNSTFVTSPSSSISEAATLTDIIDKAAAIPDIESTSYSDSDTLVSSTKSQPNTIWCDERPIAEHFDDKTIRLETILNRNKVPIEKDFHPLHRQEHKQRHPRSKLKLNLPLDNIKRKTDDPDHGFQEMTKIRRQEMLKAFNA